MSKEETRIKLYNINAGARNIRRKMKKTLEFAEEGNLADAMEVFQEAEEALQDIKREYKNLKASTSREDELLREQEGYMGFTEIVKDTVKQAAFMNGRHGGVRFHVYS